MVTILSQSLAVFISIANTCSNQTKPMHRQTLCTYVVARLLIYCNIILLFVSVFSLLPECGVEEKNGEKTIVTPHNFHYIKVI